MAQTVVRLGLFVCHTKYLDQDPMLVVLRLIPETFMTIASDLDLLSEGLHPNLRQYTQRILYFYQVAAY